MLPEAATSSKSSGLPITINSCSKSTAVLALYNPYAMALDGEGDLSRAVQWVHDSTSGSLGRPPYTSYGSS